MAHADFVITFAVTDAHAGAKGKTLFLVDTDASGFTRGRNLGKIGQHSGDTSELFYDNVRVPGSAVLGAPGNGFARCSRHHSDHVNPSYALPSATRRA